jgi:ABC-2 type transport system permease protein
MPIYEQGYRRWEERGGRRRLRFWPITREALRAIVVKRVFLVFLLASFIPFMVRATQIVVGTQVPEFSQLVPVDGRLFGAFLNFQASFVFLLVLFGGSPLVADDLRCGAILVYLSRPLTRRDYVLGKVGVVLALGLAVTLVPGLLLYGAGLGLAPETFAKWSMAWIGPAIVLHSLLVSLVLGLVTLALSSVTKSANFARLGLVALWMGLHFVAALAAVVLKMPRLRHLSLQSNLSAVGESLFRMSNADGLGALWATLLLCGLAAGGLALLVSRVRAVEIVS